MIPPWQPIAAESVRALVRQGVVVALCLCLWYLLGALPLLPPRLFDPLWQQKAATALIGSAPLPLAALLLVQACAVLAPHSARLDQLRRRCADLAVVAAAGFLLLIPLLVQGAWQGGPSGDSPALRTRLLERIGLLRQAIRTADSHADLSRRLEALRSPGLRPEDLSTPLPRLRQELLAGVAQVESRIPRPGSDRATQARAAALVAQLPSLIACLVLAVAFPVTSGRLDGRRLGRLGAALGRRGRLNHRRAGSDARAYIRSLMPAEEPRLPDADRPTGSGRSKP